MIEALRLSFPVVAEGCPTFPQSVHSIRGGYPQVTSLAVPARALTILQVEDSVENRILVHKILESAGHRVIDAEDGDEGLRLARELRPDLVIMDLYLPKMDGYVATARLKEDPALAHIPVVALTASVLSGDRERCLRAGCAGYIKKPIDVYSFPDLVWQYYRGRRDPQEMLARREPTAGGERRDVQESQALWVADGAGHGGPSGAQTNGLSLAALVKWLDAFEMSEAAVFGYTEGHGQRSARYAQQIGQRLGLPAATLDTLVRGCRLHDLGKVQAEIHHHCKGGYLSSEAWNAFAAHPRYGAELLAGVGGLRDEVDILLHHHERWDGKGYPDGLRGDEIPHLAQICGVAEAFDAMVTRAVYHPEPMYLEAAALELKRCAGVQFSPRVVEAFLSLIDEGWVGVPWW
jgi:putative two-component system response regulator